MKYDFTTIMDRVGKDAIAVDVANMGNAFGPGMRHLILFRCGLRI